MRKRTIMICEKDLIQAVAGTLFRQAPNCQPRKAEIIMTKVRDSFREKAQNSNEWYTITIEETEYRNFISNLLLSIKEVEELNLSQIEYENGVSVDDENRSKYKFTSAYDVETPESWKSDFIDLDAFVDNVCRFLDMIYFYNIDCFLCKYNDGKFDSEECKTCNINENHKCRYESSREPKGVYTFSCKYNCYKNYQICCEECKKKDECDKKCESSSDTCGLTLHKNI